MDPLTGAAFALAALLAVAPSDTEVAEDTADTAAPAEERDHDGDVAPAPTAHAAKVAAVFDKPLDIPAESELSQERIANPQYQAVLDGQHALMAGREFHAALGEAGWFLWPAHPYLRILPSRQWLRDSAVVTFHALAGNEVGDPLFRELDGADGGSNRTPATVGGVTWSPTGEWGLHAGLDQNDHSSYRTFPVRQALVGEERRDELSWVGGNLPMRSQAILGGALQRHGGLMAAQFNRGWWWSASPVSGMLYPWEGFNADFLYRVGDEFELNLSDQSWQTPGPETRRSARWRRTEVNLAFGGRSPGGWRYRLEIGGLRRSLGRDSAESPAFEDFEENRYQSRFRYRQGWTPEQAAPLRVESQGFLSYAEKFFAFQHVTDLRLTFGRHAFGPSLKGYWRNPLGSYREPFERLEADPAVPGDSSPTALYRPGRHARGWSGSGEYRFASRPFQAAATGFYAMEWGVPIFSGSVVDTLEGLLLRSGVLAGSDHRLGSFGGSLQAGGPLGPPATWRLHGGLRAFEGEDADRIEFLPSPWWLGGGLGFSLPGGLKAEGNLHWLGPKEVRGWGEDFRVPARLEGNAALVQALLDERLRLTAAFLHAFGEDVLEHPNGNPVRFRILAAAQGAF